MIGPDGQMTESELPGSQGRIALVHLLIERRPIARDRLADVIWGDALPAEWSVGLSSVISRIRTLLHRSGIDRSHLVTTGGAVELALPSDAWFDFEDALRRVDRAEGAQREGDMRIAAREATVASAILRRPLLAGIDNIWVDEIRRTLADRQYRNYEVLSEAWRCRGDLRYATAIAEAAIVVDPLRESGYRLAMGALVELGEAAAAMSVYGRCVEALRELGVSPSRALDALADRARSNGVSPGP